MAKWNGFVLLSLGIWLGLSVYAYAFEARVENDGKGAFVEIGSSRKLVRLPDGQTVKVLQCKEFGCEISWPGKRGNIRYSYLRNVDIVITSTRLRRSADEKSAALGTIGRDTFVLVHGCRPDWCEVTAGVERGWIYRLAIYGNFTGYSDE